MLAPMRKLARLKCSSCAERLGKKEYGGHLVYANPLICPKCGADNTKQIHDAIAGNAPQTEQQPLESAPEPQAEEKPARVPGTPLDNPRHESFCVSIAIAKSTATRAYINAGFDVSHESAQRLASLLLKNVEVLNRISELRAEADSKVITDGILERSERIARLERRAVKLDEVIAARASDPSMLDVPGGHTGLLVRSYKAAGPQLVEEFAVDTGLLKELRATEQQAATELGEWLTKTAIDLRSDLPVFDVPADASIEQIREAKRKLQDAINTFAKPAAVEQSVQ